jgi:hypothetical protein
LRRSRQRKPPIFCHGILGTIVSAARKATTERIRMSMLDLMMISGVVLLIVLIIAKKRMG